MKKNIAFKLALVMLCCGCSADDYTTSPDDSGQISFAVTTGDAATRGSVIDDTTMPITEQFRVFAWQTVSGTTTAMMTSGDGGDAESNVVSYTAGSWSPKKLYHWPSDDDATVSFYAVYPKDYTVVKDGSNYSLGFTIPQAVGSQHDLMVAKSQNVSYASTTDGAASLAFNHLLSQVSFQAQLAQAFTGWQVSVTGISICNVNSRGTYLYNDGSITPVSPAVVQNHPLVMAASPVVVNSTGSPVALTSTSDVALLMPQTLTAWDRVNETSGTTTPITDGCYLAVDCTITNASSTQVFSGTTYVPLAAVWLSGYRYNYLLQFGTGYTGAGDSHIADIMLSCSINNWNDPYSGGTPPDEFTQTQTVTGCDLTIDAIANQTYTGSAITPSLTVHKGDTPLTLNAANGYTVQYQNNTNVGTASVVVSGQGTYAGSYGVTTFAIDKKPITTADIVLASQSLTYNGSAQTRNVTSVGTETNTSNFTVTDNTQTNAGDYNLTVTMAANCPNYTGTATSPWSIAKAASSMSNGSGGVSFTSLQGANTEISRTITCTNCSVSNASVTSGSGFTVSSSGNTVTITRTSTAAFSGTVTVTGTPSNGNYNAPTNITISVSGGAYDSRLVDLGLSVYWASMNVGASSATGYGGYYCWGGTTDVTSKSINLDWNSNCPYWSSGEDFSAKFTKYVPTEQTSYWAGSGSPDNKLTLDLSDDAARQVMGGSWRMPTKDEWKELRDNSTWTWQSNYNSSGVAGYLVTSKKAGYTDKSIFLPAAGSRYGTSIDNRGVSLSYWSSSLDQSYPYYAYITFSDLDFAGIALEANYARCYGNSVRPVQSK